ncbi:MAG: septum formation initiator family protein [Actinomycetota bacterium]|nr:septum formation initiator family protein [Actinomycetota bacterium]
MTSRAAIVVLVVAVLVVSYASSMRAYLTQHSDIASLKSQIAKSRYDIGQLQRERNRWHDKAFVEEQARQRFGWVLPGEVSYQVIGRNGKPLTQGNQLANSSTVARQIPTPWWAKAYGTLTAVDHPRQASVPVGSIKPPAGTKKK